MNCAIPLNSVLACLGWALAAVFVTLSMVLGFRPLGDIAILCAAAGATLHVRGFVGALAQREIDAFDLGRQSVRNLR